MAGKNVLLLRSIPSTKPDIRRSRPPIQKKNHSIRATFHTAWALLDRPPFLGRPSLTGHNGHGCTCCWVRPVAIDLDSSLCENAKNRKVARMIFLRLAAIEPL